MKNKYTTFEISGLITQVAKATKIKGYTEGVIEIMFPSEEESNSWSKKKTDKWILDNNTRMIAICKFMNENKL